VLTKKGDSVESPFRRIMKKGWQSYEALATYNSFLKCCLAYLLSLAEQTNPLKLLKSIYIVCQVKNNAIYGGRIYVFIEKTIGANCEQMMEFVSKNKKDKPCK